ncbi:MAG: glycosyltransferase family 9 protein [Ignavibacteria bacterium]|nr:glycosyltransferase family 9 protein [Ignavibacteria bacterium]
MNDIKTKRILIIRLSSLGDVILTTPLVKLTREIYPDAEIDFLTKKDFSDVLKFNPCINKIIEIDSDINFSGLRKLKAAIRQNSYDLIIDAHNNLRTFYLKLFLNARKLTFKKYSLRKLLLVKFKINLMKDLPPIIQRYCSILSSPLGQVVSPGLPEIFTDKAIELQAEEIFNSLNIPAGKKKIGIVPSSHHLTKTYPAEQYIELIKLFDESKFAFVLFGKGKDYAIIKTIKNKTSANVYDLCDKLELLQLTCIMKKCDLILSGDTGPMHIAESLNKPVIMLAGSSVKEFGFYPQNEKAVVLENNSLKCRPCSHIGRDRCPKGHFKCMREIEASEIYQKILKII